MRMLLMAMAITLFTFSWSHAEEISLAVAASLKEVVGELANGYARKNPGIRFVINSGGSGILAKQLVNGARSDIFISANAEWIEYLHGKNLLARSGIIVLAYNSLVFAAPPGKKISSMKELAGLERIAIGNPVSVPAGEYAMEALRRGGMEKLLVKKLVLTRDVREGLMYAERGEVDGAFVYRSDLLGAKRVAIRFTVPPELYPRVTYPMALTPAGVKKGEAIAFFSYLQGGESRSILAKYGFETK